MFSTSVAFLNWDLLYNLTLFMIFTVAVAFTIGMLSKSMALGAWGAFLVWIHLAIETSDSLMMSFVWVMVAGVIVFGGFKAFTFASAGDSV